MMKYTVVCTLAMLIFSIAMYGQKNQSTQGGLIPENLEEMNSSNKPSNSSVVKSLFKSVEGTYQIQVSDINYKVLFSQSLYNKIIENRKQHGDVYIELDNKSTLYLPSAKEIANDDFKNLDQFICISK